ncbi:hypothetical protein GCM10027262_25050 [Nocardia tengchongensis]
MSSSTAAGPAFSHRKGLRDSGIGSGDRAHYLLRRAQRLTRPLLRAAFDTLPSELRLMAEYHLGWCDANGAVTTGEGRAAGLRVRHRCAVRGRAVGGGGGDGPLRPRTRSRLPVVRGPARHLG